MHISLRPLSRYISMGISVFLALVVILTGLPLSIPGSPSANTGTPVAHAQEPAGNVLYRFAVNTTASDSAVGVTIVNNTVVVSSAGLSGDNVTDNLFLRYTLDGTYIDSLAQGSTTGWGFRDLAYDGTYILASEDTSVKKINPATFVIEGSVTNAENSIHRGMAYDPSDNSIWSTNYASGPILHFDASTGETIANLGKPSSSIYGLALDPYTSYGQTSLWYTEPYNHDTFHLSRASTGTGSINYIIDLTGEIPGGIAGGLDIINNHPDYPGRVIAVVLNQTPNEVLFVDITDVPAPLPDTMDNVGHMGGWANAAVLRDNYAYVCEASTLKVYDISGDDPVQAAVVYLPGEEEAMGVSLSGNNAYLYFGSTIQIVDITDPLAPVTTGVFNVPGISMIQDVCYSGTTAYIAASSDGLFIVDLSDPAAPSVTGNLTGSVWDVCVSGSFVYAITENNDTLSIINVDDPSSPEVISSNVVGYSTEIFISGSRVYLSKGDNGGLQQIDIANPMDLVDVGTIGAGSLTFGKLYVLDGYLYAEESDTPFGVKRLSIYDTGSNLPVGSVSGFGFFGSLSVSGTTACLATDGAFRIVDVADVANPSASPPPETPIMIQCEATLGNSLFIGDMDKLFVYDLTNPGSPAFMKTYDQWANMNRMIAGGTYLYGIISGQVYIIDATDPANLHQAATYTPGGGQASELFLRGTTLYIATSGNTVEMVDIADPSNPSLISLFTIDMDPVFRTNYSIKDMFVPEDAQHIYIAFYCVTTSMGNQAGGFQIFDISNPASPAWQSTKDYLYAPTAIWVEGNMLYLAIMYYQDGEIYTYDVTDSTSPSWVDTEYLHDAQIWDLQVQNGIIFVSAPYGSIHTYQFSPAAGQMLSGPVGHMPESADMAITSGGDGTYVYSVSGYQDYEFGKNVYGSKGIYTLKIPEPQQGPASVVTEISPAQAAADGCTATPSEPVECEGSPVTVTATPADPWVFKEWTGAASGSSPVTSADCPESGTAVAIAVFVCPILTLTPGPQNHNYLPMHSDGTYSFSKYQVVEEETAPNSNTLVMVIEPPDALAEGCTVTPGAGAHDYAPGAQVTLTAQPADRWHFSGWTGNATGSGTTTVTVNGDTMVTARFVKEVPITDITLTANEEDDWMVSSVTFEASGTGDDKEDVIAARLYFQGTQLLDTSAYSVDNGKVTFNVGKKVPKGSSISLLMTYEFDETKAYPCDEFSAKTDMGMISALPILLPPGLKLPVPPSGVTGGPTHIAYGNLVDESGNEQWGMKGQPLEKPFVAKLYHQHPGTVSYIDFKVSPGQWGQDYGSVLSNGAFENQVQMDTTGRAIETFTFGTLKDEFGTENPQFAEAQLVPKIEGCPGAPLKVFQAFVMGMDVDPQYDGNKEDKDRADMFVSNIEAVNTFTVNLELDPARSVQQVNFDLNGDAKQGEMVTLNKVYRTTYDMQVIDRSAVLHVTAVLDDGTQIRKDMTLEALPFPGWFDIVTSISESFTKEFMGQDEKYRVGFSYPTNFIWGDAVPGNVGMLGGLDFDIPLEFTVWADYFLNQRSGFGGEASGTLTILGQEIEAEGSLEGSFDDKFEFDGGSGQVSIRTTFDLPSKSFSKTFMVSAVPLTVAGELGGTITLYVNGSAVLSRELEFDEANINPGITIDGEITVSISAACGVLKASVIGEPSATLEIQIHYTTASGTTATWSGDVVVPLRVVGSLFWDSITYDLYSTELGPWHFGTGTSSSSSSMAMGDTGNVGNTEMPDIVSTSSISGGDNPMVVWIADTDPNQNSRNPEVYYRYFDGSQWTAAAPVTSNNLWEADPVVVSLPDGRALAAWTSNDGDPTLTDLNAILACQDIAWSIWDGGSWSSPEYIINDDESDGVVALSYDAGVDNDKVVAVWLHDANTDQDLNTHTEWEILYSVFDSDIETWSTPQPLPTTSEGSADFMPAIASDALGNSFALWVKDVDGELFQVVEDVTDGSSVNYTNLDCDIYWSRWDDSTWTTPQAITLANDLTEDTPAVAFAPDGDGIAAWVTKNGTAAKLFYSVYRNATGTWSAPGLVDESTYFIEEPRLVIDSAGVATLVWRGYAGYDGDLFSSTFDLAGSSWTEPKQITNDDSTDWYVSIATGSEDDIFASWSKNDFTDITDTAGAGFSDNIQFGQTNLDSAALTGNYTDNGTDINGDGLYDYLSLAVQADIKTPGAYGVKAELWTNDKLIEAGVSATDLTTGNHTFMVNFPGGYISDSRTDGPFTVKNVTLLDENLSPIQVDFAASPHTTANYTYDQFVPGALSIANATYTGTTERAAITVKDDDMNTDPGMIESIVVTVTSTADTSGIPVTLTETSADSGIFTGSVGFNILSSNVETGEIGVMNHATVLVTYMDTDPAWLWMDSAVWTIPIIPGDTNGDRIVNVLDLTGVIRIILEIDKPSVAADANQDGNVDVLDITRIVKLILGKI